VKIQLGWWEKKHVLGLSQQQNSRESSPADKYIWWLNSTELSETECVTTIRVLIRINTIRLHSLNWKCLLARRESPAAAFTDWPTPIYNYGTPVTKRFHQKQWNPLEWPELSAVCFQRGLSGTVCFGTWTQKNKDIKPVTLRLWNNECWIAVKPQHCLGALFHAVPTV